MMSVAGLRRASGCWQNRALRRSTRQSEPSCQRVGEPPLGRVSYPGHISVRPNQHRCGGDDLAEYRKLPRTGVLGIDQLNAISPGIDVEAAGLTEVEEHWPGIVQLGVDPQRAVGGDQVEVRHTAAQQRVSLAEVVVNVQARHLRGQSPAGLVHPEEL